MKPREKFELFFDGFAVGAWYGAAFGLALLLAALLSSCATSRPRPAELPALSVALHRDSLAGRPDSLPAARPSLLQRVAATVRGGKAKSTVKFKGPTTIIVGNHNAGTAATKPGPVATGPAAVATEVKKASAPVVTGEGNHTASSRKGPAVAGDGNSVTAPPPNAWWKWLLGGLALGFLLRQFGPWLLRRLFALSI